MRADARRGGFTFVEVLIVSVMIGILAGIATPVLRGAIEKAGATKVVTDARNVTVAVRQFMETGQTLPATGPWNVAPSALEPFLEAMPNARVQQVVKQCRAGAPESHDEAGSGHRTCAGELRLLCPQ